MTIQNVEVLLILDPLPALLVLTFNLLPVPALSTFPHQFLPSFHHEIESSYWQTR